MWKGNQQDNISSDLNRFNNDANEYNYNDVGYDDRKNQNQSQITAKKEPKFEIIKNTFFSDSYCFYKFKNEVSKNGFRIFENLIINQSKERSIAINIIFFIILLFSVYVTSHYSMEGSDYLPYLEIKTTFMLLLLFFIFLIDKLMKYYPMVMFLYFTFIYLGLTINNVVFNSYLDNFNLINMAVEEILILTGIESSGILNYLQITINKKI